MKILQRKVDTYKYIFFKKLLLRKIKMIRKSLFCSSTYTDFRNDSYLLIIVLNFKFIFLGEKVPQHERKPTVPKVTEHVATPMRSRRNFVEKNALDAMISAPSDQDDPQFIDAPGGNKQSLQKSGMVPKHIEKKEFGKVPAYIKKIKLAKIDDQKRWEHEQQEIVRRREMMKLQNEERDAILQVK